MRTRFNEVLSTIHNSLPTITVQHFDAVPNSHGNVFRIMASHVERNTNPVTLENYRTMIAAAFEGKLSLIGGSIQYLDRVRDADVVSCLVRANTISKPVDEVESGRMKLVSANVFMDNEAQVWQLIGEGDNKRLVQAVKEDLAAMLNSRIARKNTAAATIIASSVVPIYAGMTPEENDYICYYSLANDAFGFGFSSSASGELMVANRLGDNEKIDISQVVACAPVLTDDELPKEVRSALNGQEVRVYDRPTGGEFNTGMSDDVLSYFRKLYNGTDYFSKLEALISQRRGFAEKNEALTTMR